MSSHNLRSLWEQRLAKQRISGQSIAAWCKEQSIKDYQFYYWRGPVQPQPVCTATASATNSRYCSGIIMLLAPLPTTGAGEIQVTVEAVRVKALNFLMNVQQEYTSFQLQDSRLQDSSSGSENGSTIIDWHQAYAPTYIPDGYEVSAISDSKLLRAIEFKNPQGSLITYTELDAGSKPALDTENASVFEKVNINGYQGTVVVKDSLTTIIWAMNDRMFMIRGEMEKDTAIKMAEGVKYID